MLVKICGTTSEEDALLAVAESGIRNAEDVRRMGDAGYAAVLVGETLVTSADPAGALTQLRGAAVCS